MVAKTQDFQRKAKQTRSAQYLDVADAYQLTLWLVSASDGSVQAFAKKFNVRIGKTTDLAGIAANAVFDGLDRQRISERAQAMRWLYAKKVNPKNVKAKLESVGGIRGASLKYSALNGGKKAGKRTQFSPKVLRSALAGAVRKSSKVGWPKFLKAAKGSDEYSMWTVIIGKRSKLGNILIYVPRVVSEDLLKKALAAYPQRKSKVAASPKVKVEGDLN